MVSLHTRQIFDDVEAIVILVHNSVLGSYIFDTNLITECY